jgi:HEAT repeat protein
MTLLIEITSNHPGMEINKLVNKTNPNKKTAENDISQIKEIIAGLAGQDQDIREEARSFLMASGETAVEPLVEALSSNNADIRSEAGRILEESKFDWSKHTDQETLKALIDNLASDDGFVRLSARNSLVKIGSAAVPGLIKALSAKKDIQRWESAKALSQTGDPVALQALLTALDDKIFDIRWVAAEGLIAIGTPSIEPLLYLAINHPDSIRLREGIHHILHALNNEHTFEMIKPVLEALEGVEAPLRVPWAAEKALKLLKG